MSDSLTQMLPALVIFVGGPLLIWWLKRGRPAAGGGLKVSARTALTRNSVVAVLEVDGKRLLVGATDHGITLLSEFGAGDTTPTQPTLPFTTTTDSGQDVPHMDDHPVLTEPTGPRTSPLEHLRVMTTRRVTRPRPPRVHH